MKDIFDDKDIAAWNDEIEEEDKQAWIILIKEVVFSGSLYFPRSTRPLNALGGPLIVSFSDGSFDASLQLCT